MASVANLPQPTMEEKSLAALTLRELADLLRSKLAAEEKVEYAAVLVQPVVVVTGTRRIYRFGLAVLGCPNCTLAEEEDKEEGCCCTPAPLPPSTHRRPMVCLLCCGVCQKCKVT
jgi:hypothetical protein